MGRDSTICRVSVSQVRTISHAGQLLCSYIGGDLKVGKHHTCRTRFLVVTRGLGGLEQIHVGIFESYCMWQQYHVEPIRALHQIWTEAFLNLLKKLPQTQWL